MITSDMIEAATIALERARVVTPHNPDPHNLVDDFNTITLAGFASIVLRAALNLPVKEECPLCHRPIA